MAATNVPRWAWDLVIAVQKYEDEHPKDGGCLTTILAAVPAEIRDRAEAIRSYLGEDTLEGLGFPFGPTIPGRSSG